MELIALNANFEPVRYIKYTNLQWNRKYYECGDFSIQMPASEYDSSMAYIYSTSRPETGIIQKVEYEIAYNGKFVQISGFFLERILWDKIIYPTYYASGNIEDDARAIVDRYKEDIPLLRLGEKHNLGTSVVWQETGGEIGSVLYSRLQTQQLSQRCRYVYKDNAIYYEVWQGLDRTQEQFENNFVVFSTTFRNLQDAIVTTDNSNYKNFFVVAGAGEGADRVFVEVDLSNGGYKRKLFVDQKGMTYNSSEQSLDEYKQSLYQKGVETALDYVDTFNVEVTAQNTGFIYMQDYDLGDRCDLIIDDLNLTFTARIIEVNEVVKKNQHTIKIVLGDKILTNIQKARLQR